MKKGLRNAGHIIFLLIILLFLLFPVKTGIKDGGTVMYNAILYGVTFRKRIDDRYESGYYLATEIRILIIPIVFEGDNILIDPSGQPDKQQ